METALPLPCLLILNLPADLTGLFGAYHDAGSHHSIVSLPNAHLEGGGEAFGEVISGMR